MATVSADLNKLGTFVTDAEGVATGLQRRISYMRRSYDDFVRIQSGLDPSLLVVNTDLMGGGSSQGEVNLLVTHYRNDMLFVKAVRQALDEASNGQGVVIADAAAFSRALPGALADVVAGYNHLHPTDQVTVPELLMQREPVTVDQPWVGTVPEDSGFVNDPICTATGHFLQIEEDFVWPERLGVLRWRRMYSSRFIASGPHGRGWASWASVGIVPQEDGTVAFQGPEGHLAVFDPEPVGLGYVRVSGIPAQLSQLPGGNGGNGASGGDAGGPADGGWEMRWDWHSRHPGDRWRFDRSGRLVEASGPASGTAVFDYEAGRLVAIRHDSGRSLAIGWDDERIAVVRGSCGREARYHYNEAGDLVHTECMLGDRDYAIDEQGLITEVVDADGVRLCHNTYDDEGRVLRQVSPFGRETTLSYLPGQRTVVSDGDDGPVSVWEHDFAGRLTALTNDDGHRMMRSFDEQGRCTSAVGFDGGMIRQSFESDDRTATKVGTDGVEERWTYDEQHRVVSHGLDGGPTMRFEYPSDGIVPSRVSGPEGWEVQLDVQDGLLRTVTDADGVSTRLDYDRDGNAVTLTNGLGAVTRIDHHVSGAPSSLTTPDGARFEFARDDAGRLREILAPTGDRFEIEVTPAGRPAAMVEPNGARIAFESGSNGEVERIIDALGGVVELQRDHLARLVGMAAPGGAKWGFDYTALGLLSMVTDPSGAVWHYGYDPEGRLTTATDPLGHSVQQRYNPAGRLVELVDRTGNTTRYNHDALGRVVGEENAEGAVTAFEWDALDRPTRVRFPDGDTLTYAYTPAGRVAGVTTAEGRGWTNEYDQAGHLVAITDAARNTTRFEWDACDRLVAQTSPSGRADRYRYDPLGRLVESERGGRVWRTEYDHGGRVTASIDPLGATTRYRYDLAGKLVAATDPLGNTLRIRYDERGNPTGLVDPFGGLVTTTYDAMRRPIGVTDQLGRTTRIVRDLAGQAVRQELPTGDVIEWARNPRGQTTDVRVNGRDVIVFERDRAGRPALIHEPGSNRTLSFGWSPGGRLRSLDVDGAAIHWEYDRDGYLTTRRDPRGLTSRFAHDRAGRLSSVIVEAWGRLDLEHDPDGRLVALRGPGVQRRWEHDSQGLIASAHIAGLDSEEALELVRDQSGRVVEARRRRRDAGMPGSADQPTGGPAGQDPVAQVTRYSYDAAGQLIGAARGSEAWLWHYDPAGRLAREDGPTGVRRYTYDDAHQLVHIDVPEGRTTFSYDAAGRRIAQDGPAGPRRYTWDELGRLSGIAIDDRHHELDVDALGQLAKVDGTLLTWDATASVPELLAVGERQVISAGGLVLGLAEPGGATSWLSGDALGTTDRGDGRDPWGATGADDPATGGQPSLGYLGELDLDGLVWLRNRVYDPESRQFLSPDPLPGMPGLPGAANPYAYANNNPIGFVDPLGLQGQPLSIDQYNTIRAQETGPQWNNIVTVGLIAVGVATMFIPGLNVVGMIAIGAAIGAVGGAAPGIIQGIQTGQWDMGAIIGGGIKGAVVGGLAGGLGGGFGALTSRFGSAGASFGNTLLRGGGIAGGMLRGGGLGAGTGALGELYDLAPLPGSDGQFNVENVAINAALGAGAGGGAALRVQNTAAAAATEQMNLAQGASPRPGAAGALATPDGQVFPASSVKGGTSPALRPDVQGVLDNIPPELRGAGHTPTGSRCVEPQSVSNALDAGVNPNGGVMSTGGVRAPGNPKHGAALPPCDSCQQLLDHFGIRWVPPG